MRWGPLLLAILLGTAGCDGCRGGSAHGTAPSSSPEGGEGSAAPDERPLPPASAKIDLGTVTLETSSTYPNWPPKNAVDGDEKTSWYSGSNDSAARGRKPWFQMTFAEPLRVKRVTILGNRDPSYYDGFRIFEGQLDVMDGLGRVVSTFTQRSENDRGDFSFRIPEGVEGVGALRFTSLRDEGDKNFWGDVAIAEFSVE